ncbi:MAG: diguanylate cyclase [Actinomycetota bacterium]|nr:diguanylate cyclase [Actinomycetota bacterium]
MSDVTGIAEEIKTGVPEILATWRAARGDGVDEDSPLVECIGRLLVVFTEFLRSAEPLTGFSREGATRALIEEISGYQREAERDAVGVIEDYAALRRCVWGFVEERIDLSALDGGEVSRFFVKLMQASDWVTEAGLEAYDRIVRQNMQSELGRAAATDLLTGLPDRDLFGRRLLPQALEEHDRVTLVVFYVKYFSETATAAAVEAGRARAALLGLADAVGEAVPEEAIRARFRDDEICVVLPGKSVEETYRLAEEILERLMEGSEDLRAGAGVAGYPEHGDDAGKVVAAAVGALNMAKRVEGSAIVVAH